MQFEFDDQKRLANLAKHKVDFLFAFDALLDPNAIGWLDQRRDYGEARWVCIISARKANEREKAKYRAV